MADVLHALPGVALLMLASVKSQLDRIIDADVPEGVKQLARDARDGVEAVRKTAGEAQAEIEAERSA